jgi:transketolase
MTKPVATREAYGLALEALGKENPRIVVLDADLSKSTKTDLFAKAFPDRFFNMGIAEADMMTTAAGLATTGMVPFASTFAIFATGRAFDQVRNSIAYPHLHVIIAATHAGLSVGPDGGSHEAIEDVALMRAIPGMTVIVPADGPETVAAVNAAAELDGPVYIRLGRSAVPEVTAGHAFAIGHAIKLRDGHDVAIIANGLMVPEAIKAAEKLSEQGIEAQVLDMATVKPLDHTAIVEAARACGAVVTAEEHNVIGGLGGAVCELLSEHFPVPVERIGVQDKFGQSGEAEELLKAYGLDTENIVAAAQRVHRRKLNAK